MFQLERINGTWNQRVIFWFLKAKAIILCWFLEEEWARCPLTKCCWAEEVDRESLFPPQFASLKLSINHDVTLCLDMPMQKAKQEVPHPLLDIPRDTFSFNFSYPIKRPRLCHAWTVGFFNEEDKFFAQNWMSGLSCEKYKSAPTKERCTDAWLSPKVSGSSGYVKACGAPGFLLNLGGFPFTRLKVWKICLICLLSWLISNDS